MLDETLYNNVCLAVMANLQGFYREDGDIYLGKIDWKNKKAEAGKRQFLVEIK